MKEIQLSGDISSSFVTLVSDEDFEYLSQFNWYIVGKGHIGRTIRERGSKGELIRKYTVWMHRVIAERMGLDISGKQADHENLNKKGNQRENIRVATNQQNQANRPESISNTSGYKGVTKQKDSAGVPTGRWISRIGVGYKRIHLGVFETIEEAVDAYEIASNKYFGEFGRTSI